MSRTVDHQDQPVYFFLASLLHPLPLAFMAAFVALGWAWWRCPRACRRPLVWLTVVLALFALSCTGVVADLAVWSLERRYPPNAAMPQKADAIVVLASAFRVCDEAGEHIELDAESTLRCRHAAHVHRQLGPCPLIVSGGKLWPDEPLPSCAAVMRELLVELGVAPSDIVLEDTSQTTYENAVNTVELLHQRGGALGPGAAGHRRPPSGAETAEEDGLGVRNVVLVTDATHMARAAGCFLALGVEVIPAACNHRAAVFRWSGRSLVPSAEAAGRFHAAVHEWLGILWYRLHGRL